MPKSIVAGCLFSKWFRVGKVFVSVRGGCAAPELLLEEEVRLRRLIRNLLGPGRCVGICTCPRLAGLLSDSHLVPANQATGIPSLHCAKTASKNRVPQTARLDWLSLHFVGLHSSLTRGEILSMGHGQTRIRRRLVADSGVSAALLPLHSFSPSSGMWFDSVVVLAPTIGRPDVFVLPQSRTATPKAGDGVSPGGGRGGVDGGAVDASQFGPCPRGPGSLGPLLREMHGAGFHA